jgi:hypothetical protein
VSYNASAVKIINATTSLDMELKKIAMKNLLAYHAGVVVN